MFFAIRIDYGCYFDCKLRLVSNSTDIADCRKRLIWGFRKTYKFQIDWEMTEPMEESNFLSKQKDQRDQSRSYFGGSFSCASDWWNYIGMRMHVSFDKMTMTISKTLNLEISVQSPCPNYAESYGRNSFSSEELNTVECMQTRKQWQHEFKDTIFIDKQMPMLWRSNVQPSMFEETAIP